MAESAEKRVELVILEGGRGDGGAGPPAGPPDDGAAAAMFGTHVALAEALSADLGKDWLFAGGQWHHWTGTQWRRETTRLIWDRSRVVCKRMAARAATVALAKEILKHASIHAAVAIASAMRPHACEMTVWDRDGWCLNTTDGILNLKTGQLGPHDRGALMTRIAGCGVRGECPTFRRYLQDVTGRDEQLQRYLQRVAGYCLTGSIEEHCILFFHGPGGSGKSTFLLVMQDLLGDYATNAPMNTFTVAVGERHPTEYAHLFGARIVTASEIEEGMRWDEGKLKAISGGDQITARYMRGDFFTFEPQFKLLLAGNHRPRMRSADDAMRRRMHVIPFRHKPQTVDKKLREKLQGELGGILKWAVEGEMKRQRLGGLMPPRIVQAATDAYFLDENTIGRWIDERCHSDPNAWMETRGLYRDFADWSRGVGEYVLPERVFAQKLEQMPGVEHTLHPRTRRRGFRGIELRFATVDLFDTAPRPPAAPGPGDLFGVKDGGVVHVSEEEADLQRRLDAGRGDPAEEWPRE